MVLTAGIIDLSEFEPLRHQRCSLIQWGKRWQPGEPIRLTCCVRGGGPVPLTFYEELLPTELPKQVKRKVRLAHGSCTIVVEDRAQRVCAAVEFQARPDGTLDYPGKEL